MEPDWRKPTCRAITRQLDRAPHGVDAGNRIGAGHKPRLMAVDVKLHTRRPIPRLPQLLTRQVKIVPDLQRHRLLSKRPFLEQSSAHRVQHRLA